MNRKKNTTSVPTLPQSKINQSSLVPPPQIMSPNQSYSTYIPPEPKFDPNDYITGSTTKRDIILYKEIFDFLDSNNNGVIQPMDLRKAFASAGKYQPKKQIIYQMIADFDQDQSGIIEFREFVRMMSMHPGEKDTDEDFENVFYQFDLDYKGYIQYLYRIFSPKETIKFFLFNQFIYRILFIQFIEPPLKQFYSKCIPYTFLYFPHILSNTLFVTRTITIDDLREMASECNENLKDEDLENIIKACDPEGNGTIRKQGFIRYMKGLQKKN